MMGVHETHSGAQNLVSRAACVQVLRASRRCVMIGGVGGHAQKIVNKALIKFGTSRGTVVNPEMLP